MNVVQLLWTFRDVFWILALLVAINRWMRFRNFADREKKRSQQLISILEAGQFGEDLTEDALFKQIGGVIKTEFLPSVVAIYLKDERDRLKRHGVEGSDAPRFPESVEIRDSKGLFSETVSRKSPQVFGDLSTIPEEKQSGIPRSAAIRAAMAVPLLFGKENYGVLFAASSSANVFDQASLHRFVLLANQAAVLFGNLKLQQKSALLAATDSATGLFTYAYVEDFLEREFRRCKYANLPLSAIILDVDQFKAVNESYGHAMADAVLRQLAVIVKGGTRATDAVCRYAGDEFMIILPETNRIGAMLVAERLRQTVEAYEFVAGSNLVRLTLTGAVASYPEDVETKKDLIEKLGTSLVEVKALGTNRVAC